MSQVCVRRVQADRSFRSDPSAREDNKFSGILESDQGGKYSDVPRALKQTMVELHVILVWDHSLYNTYLTIQLKTFFN